MIRRPPRSTLDRSSAASDVYKRQSFAWDAEVGGYRLGEILIGDPWNRRATSPLAAPGVDVRPGDVLLAINGQRLNEQILSLIHISEPTRPY